MNQERTYRVTSLTVPLRQKIRGTRHFENNNNNNPTVPLLGRILGTIAYIAIKIQAKSSCTHTGHKLAPEEHSPHNGTFSSGDFTVKLSWARVMRHKASPQVVSDEASLLCFSGTPKINARLVTNVNSFAHRIVPQTSVGQDKYTIHLRDKFLSVLRTYFAGFGIHELEKAGPALFMMIEQEFTIAILAMELSNQKLACVATLTAYTDCPEREECASTGEKCFSMKMK